MMKKLLLGLTFAILTATSVQAQQWVSSCGSSSWSKEFFKSNYTFTVRKGEIGGCEDDSKKHFSGQWDFSERQEVWSKPAWRANKNEFGKWEWSATVNIDRACRPALRSTIVQVHGGHNTATKPDGPPSFLAVNYANKFRGAYGPFNKNGKSSWHLGPGDIEIPKQPFHVRMQTEWIKEDYIKTDYWIDGKFLGSEKVDAKGFTKLFIKFGVYRVNSNCNITQAYKNVSLKKIK
jgi:hypothetical protein